MKWTDDEMEHPKGKLTAPGVYIAQVESAYEGETKNGDPKWRIKFKSNGDGKFLCWDTLVFSERSKGVAMKKLSILIKKTDDEGSYEVEEPEEIIGSLVKIDLKTEKRVNENGDEEYFLTPDFRADGFGYANVEEDGKPAPSLDEKGAGEKVVTLNDLTTQKSRSQTNSFGGTKLPSTKDAKLAWVGSDEETAEKLKSWNWSLNNLHQHYQSITAHNDPKIKTWVTKRSINKLRGDTNYRVNYLTL